MTTHAKPSHPVAAQIENGAAEDAAFPGVPFDIAWFERCEKRELDHADGVTTCLLREPVDGRYWLARHALNTSAIGCERLKRELAVSARISLPWGLPPVESVWGGERFVIVYEAGASSTLASSLDTRQLGLEAFLAVAAGAARALGEAHSAGLCHGDLKLSSIVLANAQADLEADAEACAIRLTGFDPAPPEAYRERLSAQPYLAPEVALNDAPADRKSADLYALGVALYALLTGELPIDARSAAGWYHARLAIEPLHPRRRRADVPEPLAEVLLRLLAKDPRERYVTAAAAYADLQRIRNSLCAPGGEARVAVDAGASSHLLSLPGRLFGRATEKALLDDALARVAATGKTEVVLISGSGGCGKSALVESLFNDVQPLGSRFASGKADKLRTTIPYAPVVQIVRALTLALLGEADNLLESVRERWTQRLEGQGRAIAELVPEVEHVIGPGAPLADVAAPLAQARLVRALLHTFAALAQPGAPLVIFFDDVQWADPASLAFLRAFSSEPPPNVLLLCAHRESSVERPGPHQWLRELDACKTMRVTQVRLQALSERDLAGLIGATLNEPAERVEPLARAVHAKTAGNPFFSRQLLRMLIDDEVLGYSVKAAAWTWDEASIAQRLYSDNVIDLLIRRFDRFPQESVKLVEWLACVGMRCDVALLAQIGGITPGDVHERLRPFVDANLLAAQPEAYAFLHDRVLESAYARIDAQTKPHYHARIASVMIDYWRASLPESAFDIASQIERAPKEALDPETRVAYVRVLILAGKRARNAAALDQATEYANVALGMVDEQWWSNHYGLTYGAQLLHCECLLAQARLTDAQQRIDALLAHPLAILDRAGVHRLKAVLQTVQSDYEGALSTALAGLALLGVHLHRSPTAEQMRAACESVQIALRGRAIASVRHLPPCEDRRIQIVMGLLATLTSSFFVTDGLGILHLAKMVELTLEHGVTPESPYGLAWFGVLFAGMYEAADEGLAYGQAALTLVDQHGFEAQRVATLVAIDQVSVWTRPLSFALEHARQARVLGRASGDIGMACYACNHIVSDLIAMGENLSLVDEEVERGLELTAIIQYRDIEAVLLAQRDFVHRLQRAKDSTDRPEHTGAAVSQIARFFLYFYDGLAKLFAGAYCAARTRLDDARALAWTVPAHINVADCHWYGALAISRGQFTSHDSALFELRTQRVQFARWANQNGATFRNKLLLIDAEIARLQGDAFGALVAYEKSAQAAEAAGFTHEQALAHEFAGELCMAHALESSARHHLHQAAICYGRWGAALPEERIRERHPQLASVATDEASPRNEVRQQPFVELGVEAAKAISGEAVTDRLVERLLTGITVYAGAQYGLLLLMHDDGPKIEALARVESNHMAVTLRSVAPDDEALPLAVLNSVVRTRKTLVFAEASVESPSLRARTSAGRTQRSVLCMPLLRGGSLVGVVYLENNLAPGVFDPSRVAGLEVLAPQVAVSLETARLYERLVEESEHRLNAEVSLRYARDELARTSHLTVMGSVAASIAHEVNQPLSAIATSVDASLRWLQRATPNLEEVAAGLDHIKRTSLRAVEIIRALRALAKQAPAILAPLRMDDVVRDVLDLLQPEALAQQIRVVTQLEAGDAIVQADRVQLQQVVLNLFTNAVEAMSETVLETRTLAISTRVSEGKVVMSARDRGTGIPADVLERIFDPLYTTKASGMGMGLAICRSIVESHHGTLDAFNVEDGAEFVMTLPIAWHDVAPRRARSINIQDFPGYAR
ncbi:AAA family ATPase [Paraburkholderia sp. BR10882]|uniref:trifunctional serine/threonine-protein kinase/ATP-binding protein/sensor histidine kinase n=1 Tax=unclassified Paraburkholderia TaxID=2615204 RepID=UPI0034CD632C